MNIHAYVLQFVAILSTCTSPLAYSLKYATPAAANTNTYFAPILLSLRQTLYCLLSRSA